MRHTKILSFIILIFTVLFSFYVYAEFKFGLTDAIKKSKETLTEKYKEKYGITQSSGTPSPGISAPAAPSNLVITAVYISSVTLTWQDNSNNETGFRIERKVSGGSYAQVATAGANVTGYTDTGLGEGVTYYWRVCAYNSAGNSAYSDETNAIVTPRLPHELPDTGQTGSYTTTFGEDNDYQSAASQPSYTDNGDGTITDNRTGLMWVKDGNSAGCNNGGTLTWESALTFCEGLSYAGYSDWRLPNRRELMSIVDYGTYNPSINTTYFLNTQSNWYWTSTTYVPDTSYAWGVYFTNGYVGYSVRTNVVYVRPVRGGP
ncbi:MAG: DUF1566 domain-containing protein [Elusimicrobiota bacterium]